MQQQLSHLAIFCFLSCCLTACNDERLAKFLPFGKTTDISLEELTGDIADKEYKLLFYSEHSKILYKSQLKTELKNLHRTLGGTSSRFEKINKCPALTPCFVEESTTALLSKLLSLVKETNGAFHFMTPKPPLGREFEQVGILSLVRSNTSTLDSSKFFHILFADQFTRAMLAKRTRGILFESGNTLVVAGQLSNEEDPKLKLWEIDVNGKRKARIRSYTGITKETLQDPSVKHFQIAETSALRSYALAQSLKALNLEGALSFSKSNGLAVSIELTNGTLKETPAWEQFLSTGTVNATKSNKENTKDKPVPSQ